MPLWDEVCLEVAARHRDVAFTKYHVDALAARFVTAPDSLDVVVASNLFGDILSDLGAALAGSLGIAPSANIDPTGSRPSMFEPVHGSAPDIAGKGIANPFGAIWAGAMMLEHLGLRGGGGPRRGRSRMGVVRPGDAHARPRRRWDGQRRDGAEAYGAQPSPA